MAARITRTLYDSEQDQHYGGLAVTESNDNQWQTEVRARLLTLKASLNPNIAATDVRPFVLDAIDRNIDSVLSERFDKNRVRSFVLGAYRAIADSEVVDEEDPVSTQLNQLLEIVNQNGK